MVIYGKLDPGLSKIEIYINIRIQKYKEIFAEILQESKYSNHAILNFQYLDKTNMVSRDIKESRKENDGQR